VGVLATSPFKEERINEGLYYPLTIKGVCEGVLMGYPFKYFSSLICVICEGVLITLSFKFPPIYSL